MPISAKKLTLIVMSIFVVFSPLQLFALEGDEIIKKLIDGNGRFASNHRYNPNQDQARRDEIAKGQHPLVTVLSCSDSRVPPEHIFDMGLGDLFVIRVAGNVSDTDEIGTIEYGTEHLKTPVLLILGHTKCGAVTAVFKGDKVGGSIPSLVDNIIPAVASVKQAKGDAFSDESLDLAIEENVLYSIKDLLARSTIVRELYEKKELKIIGGVYHLDTGLVKMISVDGTVEESMSKPVATLEPIMGFGFSPLLLAGAIFALVVFALFYLPGTKIQKLKLKVRLMLGLSLYLAVGIVSSLIDANGLAFKLIVLGLVALLFLVSIILTSNHVSKIFYDQKQRIKELENDDD